METNTLFLTGRAALREWAAWARDRGPDWSTSSSIHRAVYGRGGGGADMPAHVLPIDAAVSRLTPILRCVVRTYYVDRHIPWRQHAKNMQISRRDYENKLRIAETHVAQLIT